MPDVPSVGATFVIELTSPGRASVAVVLVGGPDAARIVDDLFVPVRGRPLGKCPLQQIRLGHWRAGPSPAPSFSAPSSPPSAIAAKPASEELIACRRSDNQVEVHCHGGVAAVRAVLDRLVERGCRQITWPDWIIQSERDPIRAAARIALADAPTARTAAILLDQYNGALSAAIQTGLDAASAGRWEEAVETIDSLLANRQIGERLTSPWRVVLAGPTNVGKSSLLNALAGFQRAIVSESPGTTRDVVTFNTAIDGWPVQLADTAGLRESTDELEAAGMALSGAAVANADLVLCIHDAADSAIRNPQSAIRNPHILPVLNKIDLLPSQPREVPTGRVPTSALTSQGIPELIAEIGRALVPHPPAAGAAVPFVPQQVAALVAAKAACIERDLGVATNVLQSLLAS